MQNIAISYGTYYSYLRPSQLSLQKSFNIEAEVTTFNDGEMAVEFPDSIRGKHLFIFGDATHNLVELVMSIDAAVRSSAEKITVVLPMYNWARQDKKGKHRASIGASVLANILQGLGVHRVMSIDLHAEQIQGMFRIPFEHLSGLHLFTNQIKKVIYSSTTIYDDWVLCSPDAGGTVRVHKFAESLSLPYVIMSKKRDKPGSIESMELIGDVKDKSVIIIDDIIDTGGTLIKAVDHLYSAGAKEVICVITHPVLSNNAVDRLVNAEVFLITSNTRNTVKTLTEKQKQYINVVDCSDLFMDAILNVSNNNSIIKTLS